jgi:hypothetical protein
VDQELLTEMVEKGFVAPELDPNAPNAAQAEGREGNDNWKGSWGLFLFFDDVAIRWHVRTGLLPVLWIDSNQRV